MSMFVRTNSTPWESTNQSDYKDSIVFIEDTEQIYSNGVYYGGKNNNGLLLEKITFSEESILLNPDKFYVGDTILETLDITLNGDTTKMNTYFVEFLCDNTCVILPSNIKWKNDIVPDFTKTAIMTVKIQNDTAYLIDCRLIYLGPCVIFTAQQDNSSIGLVKLSTKQTLEYSRDRSNWSNMNTSTNISLNNGDKVYVRGVLSDDNNYDDHTRFKMSGKIAASGNCNAIWNYQDLNAPLKESCGYRMFDGCTSLVATPELPATTLAENCYYQMFRNCTSLTTAPELPATTLAENCYESMFYKCTSLTTAPELLATTLANGCYQYMFAGCTSLTTAPELPATTLARTCYQSMFEGCSLLTTAPELPATTLTNWCYNCMFYGCSLLTTAPELPAAVLTEHCYSSMFQGCKSLTTAPELPAITLTNSCYYYMFYNCRKLNYIKCLATDISASDCTTNWVNGVSSTGTFIKHPSMNNWTTGISGIPSGWTVAKTPPNPNPY